MTDDAAEVPIVCPACETTATVDVDDLPEAVERHNERLHDGEEIAEIDPEIRDEIAALAADDVLSGE